MESNLIKEEVTVQSLITSVPATSGGVQTGPQPSSSSACKEPISEVGNLASVVEKTSRSKDKEGTDPKESSAQSQPNMTGEESETFKSTNDEANIIKLTGESPNTNDEVYTEILTQNNSSSSQPQPKKSEKVSDTKILPQNNPTNDLDKMVKEASDSTEPLGEVSDTCKNDEANTTILTKNSTTTDVHEMASEKSASIAQLELKKKKKLSGAQRRRIAKLKKLAMQCEVPKETVISTPNSMEEGKMARSQTEQNAIETNKKKQSNPHIGDTAALGVAINNENKTNEQKNQPIYKSKKNKLSGAAKRRFAFLVCNGYGRDEAKVLARNPQEVAKIVEKIRHSSTQQESTASRNFSAKFTQCRNIKQEDDALQTIAERKRQRSFEGTHPEAKVAKVEPKNTFEKKYIAERERKTTFKQIPSEMGSMLPHSKEVVGFFPNSVHDDTDRILSFIQCQNDGLKVDVWKLLRRANKNTNNVMLSLTIDQISAAKLAETRGKVSYKFRQITLHLKDIVDKAEQVATSTDMWPCERTAQQE